MNVKTLAAGAALLATLSAAQASSIAFGTVSPGATLNLVPAGATKATGFSTYTFSLASTASSSKLSLAGTGLMLASLTGITTSYFPVALTYTMPQSGGTFSMGSLAAGSYTLTVSGFLNQAFTGSLSFAAPVPEANQGVMLLAGLGGIAFLALRRRRD